MTCGPPSSTAIPESSHEYVRMKYANWRDIPAGPADAGKRLLHGIGVVFQRGPGRGSRGRRIRGLRTGIRIGTSRKRTIAGCRAPSVTLKPRSCSGRHGRDSEDFGMGELQLTHVFAGHTGDHHRRAGAQSHADPIHIRFTIREEREPAVLPGTRRDRAKSASSTVASSR